MSEVINVTSCPVAPTCYTYVLDMSGFVEYTSCAGAYVNGYAIAGETICAQNVISGNWNGGFNQCIA